MVQASVPGSERAAGHGGMTLIVVLVYSPPEVDRVIGIWRCYNMIPKAIFYLLKVGLYSLIRV